jgi:hypothetical protein
MKMLADLVHEGLVAAAMGESTKPGGKAIEVVPVWLTAAGRQAIKGNRFRDCWRNAR